MEEMEIKRRSTMSLGLALVIMIVIALAGGLAFILEHHAGVKKLTASEQVLAEQKEQVAATFDRIEQNLASIRQYESMISQQIAGPEINSNMGPEEKIQNEINYIKDLLDENNKMIASLNTEIQKKDSRIAAYRKDVANLEKKVAGFQSQLDELIAERDAFKTKYDSTLTIKNNLDDQVGQLNHDIAAKSGIIADQQGQLARQDTSLHTAYYIVGTYKNLYSGNILEKEGGFLGINRVKTLTGNPDPSLFKKIDTRALHEIPLNAKHWEVVTGQDPSSYKVTVQSDVAKTLTITDPKVFWAKSNYLVIVVRGNEQLASAK